MPPKIIDVGATVSHMSGYYDPVPSPLVPLFDDRGLWLGESFLGGNPPVPWDSTRQRNEARDRIESLRDQHAGARVIAGIKRWHWWHPERGAHYPWVLSSLRSIGMKPAAWGNWARELLRIEDDADRVIASAMTIPALASSSYVADTIYLTMASPNTPGDISRSVRDRRTTAVAKRLAHELSLPFCIICRLDRETGRLPLSDGQLSLSQIEAYFGGILSYEPDELWVWSSDQDTQPSMYSVDRLTYIRDRFSLPLSPDKPREGREGSDT